MATSALLEPFSDEHVMDVTRTEARKGSSDFTKKKSEFTVLGEPFGTASDFLWCRAAVFEQ